MISKSQMLLMFILGLMILGLAIYAQYNYVILDAESPNVCKVNGGEFLRTTSGENFCKLDGWLFRFEIKFGEVYIKW